MAVRMAANRRSMSTQRSVLAEWRAKSANKKEKARKVPCIHDVQAQHSLPGDFLQCHVMSKGAEKGFLLCMMQVQSCKFMSIAEAMPEHCLSASWHTSRSASRTH